MKAFYWTLACIMVVIVVSMFKGINLSGDNIVTLVMTMGGVSAMFFGGNAAEWLSQRPAGVKPAATKEI